MRLAQASRPAAAGAPKFVRDYVAWGAGPRASQYLVLGAKARALLAGRFAASIEDVRALAPAVLQHRILTNFTAEAEGVSSREIVRQLLETACRGWTLASPPRAVRPAVPGVTSIRSSWPGSRTSPCARATWSRG